MSHAAVAEATVVGDVSMRVDLRGLLPLTCFSEFERLRPPGSRTHSYGCAPSVSRLGHARRSSPIVQFRTHSRIDGPVMG